MLASWFCPLKLRIVKITMCSHYALHIEYICCILSMHAREIRSRTECHVYSFFNYVTLLHPDTSTEDARRHPSHPQDDSLNGMHCPLSTFSRSVSTCPSLGLLLMTHEQLPPSWKHRTAKRTGTRGVDLCYSTSAADGPSRAPSGLNSHNPATYYYITHFFKNISTIPKWIRPRYFGEY